MRARTTLEPRITMDVTPASSLIDGPLHIRLEGVAPGETVTMRANLLDVRGLPWSSDATCVVGAGGATEADGNALMAAMAITGNGSSRPFDETSVAPLVVEFSAERSGRTIATAKAQRLYVADDVLTIRVRERNLSGLFFQPQSTGPTPGLIVLGGSSGGLLWASQVGALLAGHGFSSLALAYFGVDEFPPELVGIPIEYFATALEWLSSRPGIKGDALGVVGRSRGAELALILGSRFPAIRSVVAYCPSSVVWNGLHGDRPADAAAWTAAGRAIPFFSLLAPTLSAMRDGVFRASPVALTPLFEAALDGPLPAEAYIPVENTNGPILLVSGNNDRMWPAARMGEQLIQRLAAHKHQFKSRHIHQQGAGHLMRPPGVSTRVLQGKFAFGGEPRAQAAANRAAWSETLAFLENSLRSPLGVGTAAAIGG